jgi:hypothetical protein
MLAKGNHPRTHDIAHWLQFSGGEPGGPVRLNARNTRLRVRRPGGAAAGGEHAGDAGVAADGRPSSSELRLRAIVRVMATI